MTKQISDSMATKMILIVSSMLVVIFLSEFGFRFWLNNFASKTEVAQFGSISALQGLRKKYTRHHYLPFIPTPGFDVGKERVNSKGFRGEENQTPKPKEEYRVVLLGGSTTYSTGVEDYRESYAYLLEEMLKPVHPQVEVINAGVGRYTTWESLINLQFRVLDLEPDLIIIYHGINDIHSRLVYPFSRYLGDNSGSRIPYSEPKQLWWENSALARLLTTKLGYRKMVQGLLYLRTHDYLPSNLTLEFRDQVNQKRYPSGRFKEIEASEILQENSPKYFVRNLKNMIAISLANDVKPMLMTFATSNQIAHPFVDTPEYSEAYLEQNAAVIKLCSEQNTPCFDFASVMPSDKHLWQDGRHLTKAGNEIKAKLVADFLVDNALLNKAQ